MQNVVTSKFIIVSRHVIYYTNITNSEQSHYSSKEKV